MLKQVHRCVFADAVNPDFQLVSCRNSILLSFKYKLNN